MEAHTDEMDCMYIKCFIHSIFTLCLQLIGRGQSVSSTNTWIFRGLWTKMLFVSPAMCYKNAWIIYLPCSTNNTELVTFIKRKQKIYCYSWNRWRSFLGFIWLWVNGSNCHVGGQRAINIYIKVCDDYET